MDKQSIINRLRSYLVAARGQALPAQVSEKAKHHILDTLGAMVSGSRFKAGKLAIGFIQSQGGTAECQVVGSNFLTTAVNAAMVNGFSAHADETDDSHAPSFTHPRVRRCSGGPCDGGTGKLFGQRFFEGGCAGI